MAKTQPPDTRARILVAAEGLACEIGPARISIEAVALRAGVSKGGLLYHFPSKHDLLRALITAHVESIRDAMRTRTQETPSGTTVPLDQARAYLRVVQAKLADKTARPGIFAAIAEDPEFIAPLRAFRAEILSEMFDRCPRPDLARVVFLAIEGLVHAKLTDPQTYDRVASNGAFEILDSLLAQSA